MRAPILITDASSAETIKYASNAFLATKISFINAIANLCEAVNADVREVALGMGYDPRIGFEFLHPGPGYGGSCFPKDTAALVHTADVAGYDFSLLRGVIEVNRHQHERIIEKLRDAAGGSLRDVSVGVWGLTFKANTDDLRESPALAILDGLLSEGAAVRAYDPVGMDGTRAASRERVTYCKDEWDAVSGVDAVVVATEWNQFRGMDPDRLRSAVGRPVLFDFRNIFEPSVMKARGFTYVGVGRA